MSVSPCECDESKGAYSSKITLQEQNEDLSGKTKEGRSICRIKDICLENEYLDTSLNIYKCTKCSSSCKTCNGAGD